MPTAKEELQKAIRDNNPGAINEALDRIRAEKRAAGQATTVSPNPAADNAGGGKTGVSGGADSSDRDRPESRFDSAGNVRNPGVDPVTGVKYLTGSSVPRTPEELSKLIETVGEAYAGLDNPSSGDQHRGQAALNALKRELTKALNKNRNRDGRAAYEERWQKYGKYIDKNAGDYSRENWVRQRTEDVTVQGQRVSDALNAVETAGQNILPTNTSSANFAAARSELIRAYNSLPEWAKPHYTNQVHSALNKQGSDWQLENLRTGRYTAGVNPAQGALTPWSEREIRYREIHRADPEAMKGHNSFIEQFNQRLTTAGQDGFTPAESQALGTELERQAAALEQAGLHTIAGDLRQQGQRIEDAVPWYYKPQPTMEMANMAADYLVYGTFPTADGTMALRAITNLGSGPPVIFHPEYAPPSVEEANRAAEYKIATRFGTHQGADGRTYLNAWTDDAGNLQWAPHWGPPRVEDANAAANRVIAEHYGTYTGLDGKTYLRAFETPEGTLTPAGYAGDLSSGALWSQPQFAHSDAAVSQSLAERFGTYTGLDGKTYVAIPSTEPQFAHSDAAVNQSLINRFGSMAGVAEANFRRDVEAAFDAGRYGADKDGDGVKDGFSALTFANNLVLLRERYRNNPDLSDILELAIETAMKQQGFAWDVEAAFAAGRTPEGFSGRAVENALHRLRSKYTVTKEPGFSRELDHVIARLRNFYLVDAPAEAARWGRVRQHIADNVAGQVLQLQHRHGIQDLPGVRAQLEKQLLEIGTMRDYWRDGGAGDQARRAQIAGMLAQIGPLAHGLQGPPGSSPDYVGYRNDLARLMRSLPAGTDYNLLRALSGELGKTIAVDIPRHHPQPATAGAIAIPTRVNEPVLNRITGQLEDPDLALQHYLAGNPWQAAAAGWGRNDGHFYVKEPLLFDDPYANIWQFLPTGFVEPIGNLAGGIGIGSQGQGSRWTNDLTRSLALSHFPRLLDQAEWDIMGVSTLLPLSAIHTQALAAAYTSPSSDRGSEITAAEARRLLNDARVNAVFSGLSYTPLVLFKNLAAGIVTNRGRRGIVNSLRNIGTPTGLREVRKTGLSNTAEGLGEIGFETGVSFLPGGQDTWPGYGDFWTEGQQSSVEGFAEWFGDAGSKGRRRGGAGRKYHYGVDPVGELQTSPHTMANLTGGSVLVEVEPPSVPAPAVPAPEPYHWTFDPSLNIPRYSETGTPVSLTEGTAVPAPTVEPDRVAVGTPFTRAMARLRGKPWYKKTGAMEYMGPFFEREMARLGVKPLRPPTYPDWRAWPALTTGLSGPEPAEGGGGDANSWDQPGPGGMGKMPAPGAKQADYYAEKDAARDQLRQAQARVAARQAAAGPPAAATAQNVLQVQAIRKPFDWQEGPPPIETAQQSYADTDIGPSHADTGGRGGTERMALGGSASATMERGAGPPGLAGPPSVAGFPLNYFTPSAIAEYAREVSPARSRLRQVGLTADGEEEIANLDLMRMGVRRLAGLRTPGPGRAGLHYQLPSGRVVNAPQLRALMALTPPALARFSPPPQLQQGGPVPTVAVRVLPPTAQPQFPAPSLRPAVQPPAARPQPPAPAAWPVVQIQPGAQVRPSLQAQAQLQTQVRPQVRAQVRPQVRAAVQPQAQAQAQVRPQVRPQAQAQVRPQVRPQVQPQIQINPRINPALQPGTRPGFETLPPLPQQRPGVETQLRVKPQPRTAQQVKPQANPQSQKKRSRNDDDGRPEHRLLESLRRTDDMAGLYPRDVAHAEERVVVKDLDTGEQISLARRISPSQVVSRDNTPPPGIERVAGHRGYRPRGRRTNPYNMPTKVSGPTRRRRGGRGKASTFVPRIRRRF